MEDTIDIRRYVALGLKWWWLLLLATVLAAGVGYWTSQRQTPVYQAAATLIVGQSIQASDLSTSDLILSERLARTYADMARRRPVLQGVVDHLSLADSWQGLRSRVQVNQVRDTQLLEIVVEAQSPEEARITADEVARQLIQLSPTALENRQQGENRRLVQERLEDLRAKIEAGQQRLTELNGLMSGALSAEKAQELQEEINNLEQLLAEWENNHTQLLIFVEGERSPNYLAIVEPAQAGASPIRPKPSQNTLLAGVVGLLLAAGVVFLIEYLDDTLKTTDDLNRLLGLTPLGVISRIKINHYRDSLIAQHNPFSPISETYRLIRSNIHFMAVDKPLKSILVTSALPAEGKSTIVANLAVVMAQAGLKTIVVDADLRQPVQHQIFQISKRNGLTGLLTSAEADLTTHLHRTHIDNLFVIPSGVIPPNPSELLTSQRMVQLVADLPAQADVVIYDSPPVLFVADALVLSNRVDGTVVVAQAGSTRLRAIRQAVAGLHQAGANLLGGVLNQAAEKGDWYYYYQHYYSAYSANGHTPPAPEIGVEPQGRQEQ